MEMMEKDEECVGLNVSYSDDILPLINRSCALSGCHVDGFNNGDFTSYDGLKERADSGSLDLRVVSQKSMPPASSSGPTLTDDERLLFKCWIEGGALNN